MDNGYLQRRRVATGFIDSIRIMEKEHNDYSIFLFIIAICMMVGCEYRTDAEIEEAKRLNGFNIVVIDSCEYLEMREAHGYNGYGYFAHKGNCCFCKERRQKELEELVIKLNEK